MLKFRLKTKKYTIQSDSQDHYLSVPINIQRERNQYASIIDIKDSHESILRILIMDSNFRQLVCHYLFKAKANLKTVGFNSSSSKNN